MIRLLPLLILLLSFPLRASEPLPVFLSDMTWPEIRQAIDNGATRILIPTAGTEQNGPHLPLGKHRIVVTHTAEQVARSLGKTLVAPVIDHVPEDPHMAYPGTVSLREDTFYALLYDTVESLAKHGFTHIYLLGDSYGNQPMQAKAAKELGKKFRYANVTVHHLHDYYAANGQVEWLKAQGYSEEEIGGHAGIRDTSEVMAIAPQTVRAARLADNKAGDASGASGRATRATPEIGKKMLALKIEAALAEIKRVEGK